MLNLFRLTKNFFSLLWAGITQLRKLNRQQLPHILDNFSQKEINLLFSALLVFLLSGGVLFAQVISQDSGNYGGEITEGLVGQPQFINPILSLASSVDTDLSKVVFAQLLKYDENQNLVADLALELPAISEDQKTFTLRLKPNLKWQDGRPLDADDVLFTIQAIQNADYESPLRPNWSRVRVDKVDDLTLTFKLREVSASFMNNFAIGIIPKHVWDGLTHQNFRLTDYNLKSVGSGPFVVREIKKTANGTVRSISMDANEYYYAGRPFLDRITFKFYDDHDQLINAYQGREITNLGFVAFDNKALLSTTDRYQQYRVSLPQYQAVFFNLTKSAVVTEKAVRQALWLTTDRQAIINDVYSNQVDPAYGPLLPESLGYNPVVAESVHYSIEEANTILDKAGWAMDPNENVRKKNDKALEFNLATNGTFAFNVKTAQMLKEQWSKIGARVNLIIVGSSELQLEYIRPRNFDALLISENLGADPDPFPFWHSSQAHDPGLNFSGFSSTEADKLITDARQTADANIRSENYRKFQEITNDQLPAIFLVRSLYIYNVPKKIQGISLTKIVQSSERFMDIHKWYEAE